MALTFEDVIEEHRQAVGAVEIRLTPVPGSTPEGLRETLAQLRAEQARYDAFTPLEREKALTRRLKDLLRDISRHCSRPLQASPELLEEKLSQIFLLTDLIPDQAPEDLEFMIAERQRHGEPLPEALRDQPTPTVPAE